MSPNTPDLKLLSAARALSLECVVANLRFCLFRQLWMIRPPMVDCPQNGVKPTLSAARITLGHWIDALSIPGLFEFIHRANPDQDIRAWGFRQPTYHVAAGYGLQQFIDRIEGASDEQLLAVLSMLDGADERYADYFVAIDNEYFKAVDKAERTQLAKQQTPLSVEALAIAVKIMHPEWTDKLVAQEIGTNPKYLSRLKGYRAAKKAIKSVGAADMIRGERRMGRDGTYDLEAWDNASDR